MFVFFSCVSGSKPGTCFSMVCVWKQEVPTDSKKVEVLFVALWHFFFLFLCVSRVDDCQMLRTVMYCLFTHKLPENCVSASLKQQRLWILSVHHSSSNGCGFWSVSRVITQSRSPPCRALLVYLATSTSKNHRHEPWRLWRQWRMSKKQQHQLQKPWRPKSKVRGCMEGYDTQKYMRNDASTCCLGQICLHIKAWVRQEQR